VQDFVESTLPMRSRKPLHLRLSVSAGRPSDEIIKAATRGRSDLIVMGTHGLTGPDRLLMGSTMLGILQRAMIPVLAIPPTAGTAPATTPVPSWPGQPIMAALELDESPEKDVEIAARIAQWFGASLLLVHVVGEIPRPRWLKGDLRAHDRIRVARAQRRLEELGDAARSLVKTESRVICGPIPDEIAALAAAERAGLLITALRDRRGWFGAKRGSISYHVLTQAITPVLAYPPRWRPR
jgi:nucleotide-binding universal stress UspA family protein